MFLWCNKTHIFSCNTNMNKLNDKLLGTILAMVIKQPKDLHLRLINRRFHSVINNHAHVWIFFCIHKFTELERKLLIQQHNAEYWRHYFFKRVERRLTSLQRISRIQFWLARYTVFPDPIYMQHVVKLSNKELYKYEDAFFQAFLRMTIHHCI